jgi:murein DD-endopeptidase MepM/ murein hydrolase activator NlpD
MRFLLKLVGVLALVCLLVAGGAYFVAGRMPGPAIRIDKPGAAVGARAPLDVAVEAPAGHLSRLSIVLEQNGKSWPLFDLASPGDATLKQESADRIRITREFGRQTTPELREGPARIVVTAVRPVLYGMRQREATATRDVVVRLVPPRIAVVSTHHYVNHGGSEMVVYRVTPPGVESGVRVGDVTYPGFPASGAGVAGADDSLKVAFFALRYDQDLNTPIHAYARDEAGNASRADFDFRVFPKPQRRSRIEIDDRFVSRVVPAILERTPGFDAGGGTLVEQFVAINGKLRRENTAQIEAMRRKSEPRILWEGPFLPLGNAQVESAFADHRTYFYNGKEIDQQVHLGFDLAVTTAIPLHAANRGRVIHADYLGIYGNCIVIDHGMGVQSLYGHLSSFDVKPGDEVQKNQVIGRSGMTGLAGGDHLHFTMLVNGQMVTPVEWWDPHWIEDRIVRKLREAGAAAATR